MNFFLNAARRRIWRTPHIHCHGATLIIFFILIKHYFLNNLLPLVHSFACRNIIIIIVWDSALDKYLFTQFIYPSLIDLRGNLC